MLLPMYNFMFVPFIPPNCDKPPTMYQILNSIVNGDKEEEDYTKIKDLANAGRTTIFNFSYPLSSHISKEDFESLILKHYMMRRIGFDTVTAFRINLDAKLNEIMPMYNKMFDSLDNWNIFNDGEKITRIGSDSTIENSTQNSTSETTNELQNASNTETNTENDRRFSDTPQDRISDIKDGKYVTDFTYEQGKNTSEDTSTSSGTSSNETNNTNATTGSKQYNETIEHTNANKIEIMKEMQENIKSIYSLIFKDLDILFYGIE